MTNKFSSGLATLVFLLASLSVSTPAHAAVAEWKSLEEKAREADAIVLGELVSSESRLDPDGRWIRTWSTFHVTEVLKGGSAERSVTIVTPGGSVNGIHQESVGTPSFEPGRQQVLFLRGTDDGLTPLYLDQGVYDVDRDDRDRALVRPVASNLILFDDQTGQIRPAEATRTLDDFRARIRASIDRDDRGVARATSGELPAAQDKTDFLRDNGPVLILLAIGVAIALITWVRRQ